MRLTRGFDLDPSCKLWLPFYAYGAEQTKIWDQSGNGNHGTITGATPTPYSTSSGVYESIGWGFDGVDDFVGCGIDFDSDYFTCLAWIRPLSNAQNQNFISRDEGGGPRIFSLNLNAAAVGQNTMYYYQWITDDSFKSVSISAINNDLWHCFGATFDGANIVLYHPSSARSATDAILGVAKQGSSTLDIGARANGTTGWSKGNVGEVLIFNRALSATEIRNYYERTRHIYGV